MEVSVGFVPDGQLGKLSFTSNHWLAQCSQQDSVKGEGIPNLFVYCMAGVGWENLPLPCTKQWRMRLFQTNGTQISDTVAFKNTFIFHEINISMKKMNGILKKK